MMRNILIGLTVLLGLILLQPLMALATTVFSQNQIILDGLGSGVVVSTSTALGAKLEASSSPTVSSITATSTTGTSTITNALQIGTTAANHQFYVNPTGTYSVSDSVGGSANMTFSNTNAGLNLFSSNTSMTGAVLDIDFSGSTDTTQPIRIESSATNQSTFNIQGGPTGLGVMKISSLLDQGVNGSLISLDASTNSNTGQGLFIKGNATGNALNIQGSASQTLFKIDAAGNATSTGLFENDHLGTNALVYSDGSKILQSITLGTGLSLTGSTLSATGGGSGTVSTSSSETANEFPFWTTTNGTPALLSGTSNLFRLGTNIGVGTSSPFATLSISTTSQGVGTLQLLDIASTTNANILNVLGNGCVSVGYSTFNANCTSGGSWLLDVNGTANFQTAVRIAGLQALSASGGNTVIFGASASVTTLNFDNSGSVAATLTGGNLGVGTTSPFQLLSVNGNGWFNGPAFHVGNVPDTLGTGGVCAPNDAADCFELVGNDNTTAGVSNIIQNTNDGASAYSDYFLANASTTVAGVITNYGDLNINSPVYSDSTFGSLFNVANQVSLNTNYTNGQLLLSSTGSGGSVIIAAGGNALSNINTTFVNGKVGIGTTTPFATLSVSTTSAAAFAVADAFNTTDLLFNTASTTGSIFTVAATTSPSIGSPIKLFDVDQYGHITASSTGAAPTISSCGTGSPSLGTNSNDVTGDITTGTSASACTLTFAHAYSATPEVFITDSNTSAVIDVSARSTTAFTVSIASALSAVNISYFVVIP